MHSISSHRRFQPGDEQWKALSELVQKLEESWAAGSPMDIAELLPTGVAHRPRTILLELIKVEQELAWTSGRAKRLEEFVTEWPELMDDPG
jgi:hypothetical protein